MALVKYVGPFDAVDIPSAGITAINGEPVDVPADVAKSLLEQDAFESAKSANKEK